MPTGYTADVQDGKITEFRDFAMQCARAFGALVTMRDDPHDAPIPEAFEPSDYNAKRLAEATAALAALEALSPEECEARARAAFQEATSDWECYNAKKAETKHRYEAMLDKVRAWSAPTADHEGMKKFMIDQLEESIRFDCSGGSYYKKPEPIDTATWFAAELARLNHDISYHAQEQAKEIERARTRTEWITALRASLEGDVTRGVSTP